MNAGVERPKVMISAVKITTDGKRIPIFDTEIKDAKQIDEICRHIQKQKEGE